MESSQCRRRRCIDMLSRSRYISAPMVNQSDPMWRQLVKKYGCDVVYTQMLESDKFVNDANYRREMFLTHSYDHPLIVQFSSNCPITFLSAARLVEPYCEGVELNLGCPQRSARSGVYGAFLLDPSHHRRVVDILTLAHHSQLQVPICAKIRLLPTLDETIRFCKLIAPFIDVLTIHGRTRGFVEERRKGPADLNQVKRVFQALRSVEEEEAEEDHDLSTSLSRSSPSNQAQIVSSSDQVDHLSHPHRRRRLLLWTNGNVRSSSDVEANISYTRADGCMVGEGLLNDPTLFSRCRLRENGNQPNLTQIDLPTIHSTIDHSHQFPGLSLQEFDRRIGIIDEYIHLLQEAGEDQQFRSPFESNQQESSYSYSSPSIGRDHTHLSTIISENEFLTPFVSWSSFLLHLYHILNSDPHARFLYHTQLVDDFLDSTNLTDLTHVCAQVRDRIESNRRFDPTLELVIQQNRPLRQSHRQALKRVKEFESTGFEPPINTRQRKRQRWKQRKEDEKRRKVEPALLDEEKHKCGDNGKDNPRIDPVPVPVPVPASSDS